MTAQYDLSGKWQFMQYPQSARRIEDLYDGCWQGCTVPGSVYGALIEAGQIDMAELVANPEDFDWVSQQPWIFSKTFELGDEFVDADRVDLVFDGLDTVATIWLNGKLLQHTENMFRQWRIDTTGHLKSGQNTVMVKFDPAGQHARQMMQRHDFLKKPKFASPERVFIRKAQYQFGWDFAPAMCGCGIWRNARLEAVNKARLADVSVRTLSCDASRAQIEIAVMLDAPAGGDYDADISISGLGADIRQRLSFKKEQSSRSVVIDIDSPQLWWPAGYGRQYLYNLAVTLSDRPGRALDSAKKHFGIRKIRLQTDSRPKAKFAFSVNGLKVHVRGANWVPASMLPGQVTSGRYRRLLYDARRAKFNMLRVWGGGYYESDEFYDLCDKLGILVWQDFMFACADYPDSQWFIDSFMAEADQNVSRIRNHPCLALLCGNNEIEWHFSNGQITGSRKLYCKRLFRELLPDLLNKLAPDIAYIATTPLGEGADFKKRTTLTRHHWDFWHGPLTIAQLHDSSDVGPFTAEFGMQSLPAKSVTAAFSMDGKCPPCGSWVLEKHNYHTTGNHTLYRYITELFPPPKDTEQLRYFSQVAQARACWAYIQTLRASREDNSGMLFWQYNEPAHAISWSAVDVESNPKALYYYARRCYGPYFVGIEFDTQRPLNSPVYPLGPIHLAAINDSAGPLSAQLSCSLISMTGTKVDEVTFPVALQPWTMSRPLRLPETMSRPKSPRDLMLRIRLNSSEGLLYENLWLYMPDKYMKWHRPRINMDIQQFSPTAARVSLDSDIPAKDVQLTCDQPVRFSDNYFNILPGDRRTVHVKSSRSIEFKSTIRLRCVGSSLESH